MNHVVIFRKNHIIRIVIVNIKKQIYDKSTNGGIYGTTQDSFG